MKKIHIIGIGDDGLEGITAQARRLIEEAELVLGAEPTLQLLPKSGVTDKRIGAGRAIWTRPSSKSAKAGDKAIVVLASGDPLFYGVARYLCDKLGKDRFEVVPHVSSMQLAFARVKESWEEAYLTNLANRIRWIGDRKDSRIGHRRAVHQRSNIRRRPWPRRCWIGRSIISRPTCARIWARPTNALRRASWAKSRAEQFRPLNVMILVRRPEMPDRPTEAHRLRLFGNPDEVFLQSRPKQGLLTPAEVRQHGAGRNGDLGPTSMVWDIGAGSGSVSIEAAMLAERRKGLCHRDGSGRH